MWALDGRVTIEAQGLRGPEVLADRSNRLTSYGLQALAAGFGGGYGTPVLAGEALTPVSAVDHVAVQRMALTAAVNPPAPDLSDTGLTGSVRAAFTPASDPALSVAFPGPGQVAFVATLAADALVGVRLTEEGLFSARGVLLARCVFPAVLKDERAFRITHTFTLARA